METHLNWCPKWIKAILWLLTLPFHIREIIDYATIERPLIEENVNTFRRKLVSSRFTEFDDSLYAVVWNCDHKTDKRMRKLANEFYFKEDFSSPDFDVDKAYDDLLKFADENGF